MIRAVALARVLGLPKPTAEQVAVVEAPLAPTVVVAGAGSGKTETMASRVVWLIANRLVAPEAVLGLTFTRKAADELGQRIRRRLHAWRQAVERDGDDRDYLARLVAGEPTVLTYDAYAARLVSEHALRVGAEPRPRLLSPAACWQLADAVTRRYPGRLPAEAGVLASVVGYVLDLSRRCADHLVAPADVAAYCDDVLRQWDALPVGGRGTSHPGDTDKFIDKTTVRRALIPLVQAYDDARRAQAAVDFGDQLAVAACVAQVADVVRLERERYAAVLLDEYQDTGHAQSVMLRGLFGDGHPVTAVGDAFQSIYGWRGASAGNLGRFTERFTGARRYPLATSWRNDAAILRAANAVAAPLRAGEAGSVELRARTDAGPGRIRLAMTETDVDEAAWVAAGLCAEWDGRPSGDRTAAVLVRRRSQIPLLHAALVDVGLPVEVVDLGGLLSTPEVVDVVATLRVLADDGSGPALARLLAGARWRIGPRDLAALSAQARQLARARQESGAPRDEADASDSVDPGTLIEALDDLGRPEAYSAPGLRRLRRLADELRLLRRRLAAPLPDLVADVERTIGVDIEVQARPDRGPFARAHLDRFLDEAAAFAADADDASLGAFLAYLSAAEEEENGLEPGQVEVIAERVQVLTVHGAKGLEWDVVALPGLVGGVFPATPQRADWTRTPELVPVDLRGDRDDLPELPLGVAADRPAFARLLAEHGEQVKERHAREERRLAYVAVTRARSVLLASGFVWDLTKTAHEPSPFLDDIRPFGTVETWFTPEPNAANPQLERARTAPWPVDPLAGRRRPVEEGAELVRAAQRSLFPLPSASPREAEWAQAVDVLLAERQRLTQGDVVEVALPDQLSVSQLVVLRADPAELARRLRRPLPARPAPLARRGTAFHAWLEQRWSAQPLLDLDELPGAADDGAADTAELDELRAAFEQSSWAERVPVEVEVPFEMTVGAAVVRGRMDAVFAGPDGFTVVDWKTGARPHGAEATAAAVQLAVYRLAWGRLAGVDPASVGAAFHYVRTNETVCPVDLLDAAGLEALLGDVGPAERAS